MIKIILNLFVEHPGAAIVCLLIGGGILFGFIGGLINIKFFKDWWFILILLGILVLLMFLSYERSQKQIY